MSASKRPYDASRRRAAAQERRDRIVDVAAAMFAADGWGATTMARVAADAGVSVELVTTAYPTKGALAMAALQRVSFGGDRDLTTAFAELGLDARPPGERLDVIVDFAVRSLVPMAPLIPALQVAEALDAAAAQEVEEGNRRHVAASRTLARAFVDEPSDHLVDEVYLLTKGETFVVLTGERGWTVAQYASWLRASLARLLVVDETG
ncbi:TetR/AcrR family transcriptional regulator [Nocardioides nitrophenolicus]|uniref:TetR/AcrR family transcriptional regulator n=1 Tax=Nocardioides nitrophenolicus TaxID=60489 RepID=UPI0019579C1D|nr:TetR family transcriptional regulator [Nocardioides nitrophenolicus]MBM7518946.1 AcrR family transcriptional regulator [Nocardioides nitrophenolicus]